MHKELPNIITVLAEHFPGPVAEFLLTWQNVILSLIVISILILISFAVYSSIRKNGLIPSAIQNVVEIFVEGVDGFVCSILGHHGRKFVPFIGTLFIYILFMNLLGLIPYFKSPTASWSTTMALALCVFVYLQYTALKELGFKGYTYHLLGKPKGVIAFSVVIPLLMFVLHVVSEFVRPLSLSLRLRSNIWGDEVLFGVLAGFGLQGVPLLIFNSFLALIAALVQAVVFCLLTTIYFALVLVHEE
ncbi:MAG: F0F1 ATP synthase subunit A [Candidatus Omnitrophica bacterium]|nr:F0F1 ATP synthase subunit A [Candidatus Omnitrophota bacterium]